MNEEKKFTESQLRSILIVCFIGALGLGILFGLGIKKSSYANYEEVVAEGTKYCNYLQSEIYTVKLNAVAGDSLVLCKNGSTAWIK